MKLKNLFYIFSAAALFIVACGDVESNSGKSDQDLISDEADAHDEDEKNFVSDEDAEKKDDSKTVIFDASNSSDVDNMEPVEQDSDDESGVTDSDDLGNDNSETVDAEVDDSLTSDSEITDSDNEESIDSNIKAAWQKIDKSDGVESRSAFGAAYDSKENVIYVSAGNNAKGGFSGLVGQYKDFKRYLVAENRWESLGNLPITEESIADHTMVFDENNGEILLFSGSQSNVPMVHGKYLDKLLKFSIKSGDWSEIAFQDGPDYRANHAAVMDNSSGRMYISGGVKGSTLLRDYDGLSDLWVYDIADNKWTKLASLPFRVDGHSMVVAEKKQKIYLFGGRKRTKNDQGEDEVENSAEILEYDILSDKWIVLTPSDKPEGRNDISMCYVQGQDRIVMMGGGKATSPTYKDTWIFDIPSTSWKKLEGEFPLPRHGGTMFFNDSLNEIYTFGGKDINDPFVWKLKL